MKTFKVLTRLTVEGILLVEAETADEAGQRVEGLGADGSFLLCGVDGISDEDFIVDQDVSINVLSIEVA